MDFVMLLEPDGTENGTVTRDYAIVWCRDHPGWSWREL